MDNQRPILYLALIFILFLIWQAWQQDYGPKPEPGTVSETAQGESSADRPAAAAGDVPSAPVSSSGPGDVSAQTLLQSASRVRVITDVLDVEIDTRGGDIRRAELLTYPVSIKRPDVPVRLLDDEDRIYVAQSGLIHDLVQGVDANARAPSHHTVYTAGQTEYRLPAGVDTLEVPLIWESPEGIKVTKIFTFHRGQFLLDVDHRVENGSDEPWVGRQYRQLRHGPAQDDDGSRFVYTYTGSAYYDDAYKKLPFDDMTDEPLDKDIVGGWAAILQHYFLSAWIPIQDQENHYYSKVLSGEHPQYIIGLRSPARTVAPGTTADFTSQFYVGPKIQEHLGEIATGLELSVDYGYLTILSKPLFWVLEFIHGLIGNWGWAIILVTVMIKAVFYKLSETSYRSMARMRAVQPKLQALKERYGEDKQKMNQALMDLYKTEKINPLGGCLPILVQIPVFIAFYWMLLESVELRQAPWILWVQDLSTKDPYFVLPVLMGISMIAQQRLNPAPLDPVQQKVMMLMPIVFTVFFMFFPSGLVLYWLTNNLLSIAQQWVITRRMEQATKKT